MVLREWQRWHRLSRLAGSVNSAQSPLWSRMWSTSVARTRSPRRAHSRQKGSRSSWPGRRSSVHTGREYQPCQAADSLRAACLGLWTGHQPSRVSSRQPGWRQGRSGLLAMGYHLHGQRKSQSQQLTHTCVSHWLWLSKHWPLLISTRNSCLHTRQNTGSCFAIVSGTIRITRRFLQNGHVSHPPVTVNILPRFLSSCNAFSPISIPSPIF